MSSELMRLECRDGHYVPKIVEIKLPQESIHKIGSKKGKDANGRDVYLTNYQIESPIWDIIGRNLGVSYSSPKIKSDDGKCITIEVTSNYYNEHGVLITDSTEYQVDCWSMYQKMRMDWKPKQKWVNGSIAGIENPAHAGYPQQSVTYGADGMPIINITIPADAEVDLYSNYLTLLRNRHKKAETCCRRSLVQRAVGKKLATIKPGDTNPVIQITRFVPVLSEDAANDALSALVGSNPDAIDLSDVAPDHDEPAENVPVSNETQIDPLKCQACGVSISEKISEFSSKKFAQYLCMNHQKEAF